MSFGFPPPLISGFNLRNAFLGGVHKKPYLFLSESHFQPGLFDVIGSHYAGKRRKRLVQGLQGLEYFRHQTQAFQSHHSYRCFPQQIAYWSYCCQIQIAGLEALRDQENPHRRD